MPDDRESLLLVKASQGDIEAFEELINNYERLVFNVVLRKIGDYEEAKDITQETLIKVYKNIEKCKDMKNFRGWICTIALNTCIDNLRKRKRTYIESMDELLETEDGQAEKQFVSEEKTPEERLIQSELSSDIQKCLNKLSDAHKTIIILRDIQGLSYQEIAEAVGEKSIGTVKSRLSRARDSMKKFLRNF